MRSPKELTRAEVIRAANHFRWRRKMPKWTAIVEGRELPARPLVLEAAGVPPNDPTNSHQAIEILKRLGFETRYNSDQREVAASDKQETAETGNPGDTVLEIVSAITRGVADEEWGRIPTDLSKNADHYLYGHKKSNQ